MIEHRFDFRRLVGWLLICTGALGIGYLGWIYLIWGYTLPRFPETENQVLAKQNRAVSFGDLLDESTEEVASDAQDRLVTEIQLDKPAQEAQPRDVLAERLVTDTPRLTIPVLNLENMRLQLDVDGNDEQIYDTVLTRAVAHLKDTAYPGEYGNAFLFGHSKLPIFAGSDYESVFTNLPRIKTGDIVWIDFQGQRFTYQISQTGVVDPDDVFVMNQPESKQMLTLMTCIPPGFDNQRYIAVGELVRVEEF